MSNNPYEILHLDQDANFGDIKQRYLHLQRNLHPDKQPLQNYQITKKLFEEVDQAYKSISSPLRRFLYKQYGANALKILQEVPQLFEEYDMDELSEMKKKDLKQLMIFLLYERQASFEMDKTKLMSRMVVNITKTLKGKPKSSKRKSKRNFYIPQIQNCSFQYEMVLPEYQGFSNSFAIGLTTNQMKSMPKNTTNLTLNSSKRLNNNYMLSITQNYSNQDNVIDIGIDKICENHLILKFVPISITNGSLSNPRIGLQKSFNSFQYSLMTDLKSINFNFNQAHGNGKKISRSVGIYMENNSIGLNPKIQYELNSYFHLFAQFNAGAQFVLAQKNINLKPAFLYGYKLILLDDLKIQLASCIGSNNYFQLSFISNKYRVSIPMISSQGQFIKFQLFKVTTMLLAYGVFEWLRLRQRNNKKLRQKTIRQNEYRLKETKRQLNRHISYIEIIAKDKRQKQVKYNGLIILRAYLGQLNKINDIQTKMNRLKFNKNHYANLDESINQMEIDILALDLQVGEVQNQVQNITAIIQSQVIGGQIINYNLNQLQKYSPILNTKSISYIFIAYLDRGCFKTIKLQCKNNLNIGILRGLNIINGMKRILNHMMNYII